jgi:hypothetical protein
MACKAIEEKENPLRVQRVVKMLFHDQPTETAEDLLVWYAMGKIVGKELPSPEFPTDEDEEDKEHLFSTTSWAWMSWAANGPSNRILERLNRLDLKEGPSSVLHQLALSNWAYAVQALHSNDLVEAKRRYKRSLEIGGQFGTDTNSVILWTYAATFLKCFM